MTRTRQQDTQGDPGHPLGALGVSVLAEQVYRLLLELPGLSVTDAARRSETTVQRTRDAFHELESKGLATQSAGRPVRFQASAPELALGILLRQQEDSLDRIRAATAEYQEAFTRANQSRGHEQPVEVVLGREAVVQRIIHLQQATEEEILVLDKPPYAATERQVTAAEEDHLHRGVRARVIYDRAALETTGQLTALHRLGEAGEEARLVERLPTKLMISDRRYAIVPLGHDGPGIDGIVLVNATPLLDALIALFESLWRVAVPVGAGTDGDVPDGLDTSVLTLLAAGLKDEAIAHQLGISLSTVQRRLRRAMDLLGAHSRVQLVLQASRAGLL